MKLTSKSLGALALTTLSLGIAAGAHAQVTAWPTKPVVLVVPTAPGGTTDISARMLAGIAKVMATPAFQAKAAEQGARAGYMSPQQLPDFSKAELARWAQVVKTSKIEAD